MVKIEWNEGLATGIELVDEQHKMLLDKLNDISEAIENQHGVDVIIRTLDFMMDYTDFHFSTEENHMEKNQYPRIEYHKKMHKEFVDSLKNMVEEFREDGATQRLAESVNIFLFNWLVTHIRGVDGAFGKYVKEKGIILK
jgi:hemerythrin